MKRGQKVWVTHGTNGEQTGVIISTEKVAQGTTVFVKLEPVGKVVALSDDEVMD